MNRQGYIGSTDAAAILGISPWTTPLDLYLEKIGHAREVDPAKARIFQRGKRMEPYIIDMVAEEYGLEITARNKRYADPEYPFLECEVDFETAPDVETVNNEIKTISPFAADKYGEEDTDDIPIYYAAQAQHSLMVTGRQRCIFWVLVGSDDLRRYEILRDEETIVGIRSKELAFWTDCVLALEPPDPIRLSDVYKLFRRDVDTIIAATPEITDLLTEYRSLKDVMKHYDKRLEEIKYEIGAFALGAEIVAAPEKLPRHIIMADGAKAMTIAFQHRDGYTVGPSDFYTFNLPRGKK